MSQFFTVLKIDLSMKYYFGVALAVAGLTFCLYQMFFHPLAKYPSPTLAKFTAARAAYYAWKGDVHLDIWLCHKKYEIRSEAMLLTIAGNDTTSTTLGAALFYLGKNLHAYEKLAGEIRSKFRVVDEIGQDKTLRNCHYLHGCIYESLRMSPPVGSSMWREVGPGGTSIDGEYIPCGYGVGTGIYSIHHNAEYFPRPHDFIPERWLSEKDGFICKEQADIASAAYIPFSAGTRACLGRHLAITELLATIAALVLLYDFRISHTGNGELGSGHALGRNGRTNPGEFQLYDRVTSGKKGPILQLRSRKGN
ncbi:cytochrome P450 [Aspergillus transmontanensis]|uniref:Cytochrome P450 n=1 Tax=Aspergillus transmontanensis TaxID=1034304 RepID=A0A5N6VJQ5_9EURO|nr:cytochrome P450 [Aspergillus transmontanensis]